MQPVMKCKSIGVHVQMYDYTFSLWKACVLVLCVQVRLLVCVCLQILHSLAKLDLSWFLLCIADKFIGHQMHPIRSIYIGIASCSSFVVLTLL